MIFFFKGVGMPGRDTHIWDIVRMEMGTVASGILGWGLLFGGRGVWGTLGLDEALANGASSSYI